MSLPCFQVDAFADRPFSGNPAAVCLLEDDVDPQWMQSVAAEMNLSETAFVRPAQNGFEIRWFTPEYEVDLCGHATLATAHVLWSEGIVRSDQVIHFQSKSGALTCEKGDIFIEMNFPATPPQPTEPPTELLASLGLTNVVFSGQSPFDSFLVVDSEQTVRELRPNFRSLGEIDVRGVIVTAESEDANIDFVSRFFAPTAGIDEDPVTGSAHCCLGPFWQQRLKKSEMVAFQASNRGGEVRVQVAGDRVVLGGKAITVVKGELTT